MQTNNMVHEYKRILLERGLIPADCVVLHFRFNGNQNSFHFEIMEKKLNGYIYDSYEDGNVYVVLNRDDSMIEEKINTAISLNGECLEQLAIASTEDSMQ